jgi:hypothetical protein
MVLRPQTESGLHHTPRREYTGKLEKVCVELA